MNTLVANFLAQGGSSSPIRTIRMLKTERKTQFQDEDINLLEVRLAPWNKNQSHILDTIQFSLLIRCEELISRKSFAPAEYAVFLRLAISFDA